MCWKLECEFQTSLRIRASQSSEERAYNPGLFFEWKGLQQVECFLRIGGCRRLSPDVQQFPVPRNEQAGGKILPGFLLKGQSLGEFLREAEIGQPLHIRLESIRVVKVDRRQHDGRWRRRVCRKRCRRYGRNPVATFPGLRRRLFGPEGFSDQKAGCRRDHDHEHRADHGCSGQGLRIHRVFNPASIRLRSSAERRCGPRAAAPLRGSTLDHVFVSSSMS